MTDDSGFSISIFPDGSPVSIPAVVLRSSRRTLAMSFEDRGLVIRAPLRCGRERIAAFLRAQQPWLEKQGKLWLARRETLSALTPLTSDQLDALRAEAKAVFPARVAHYAPLIGVDYGTVTIRAQKTRWGSCSVRGNLSFNCLLLLAPAEVLDSVVVHELCHLKHMNHSPAFYAAVTQAFPNYAPCRDWLKAHGDELLRRLPQTFQREVPL